MALLLLRWLVGTKEEVVASIASKDSKVRKARQQEKQQKPT